MIRELFGGAMSCSIPDNFEDVSNFRQVPDTQEVFADPTCDQSIIIEILEYEKNVANSASAQFFFKELGEDNGCLSNQLCVQHEKIFSTKEFPLLKEEFPKVGLVGLQKVAKFNEATGRGDAAINTIQIHLINIRLPQYTSDIVITFNKPIHIGTASSSNSNDQINQFVMDNDHLVSDLMKSFQIKDYGLFCQE